VPARGARGSSRALPRPGPPAIDIPHKSTEPRRKSTELPQTPNRPTPTRTDMQQKPPIPPSPRRESTVESQLSRRAPRARGATARAALQAGSPATSAGASFSLFRMVQSAPYCARGLSYLLNLLWVGRVIPGLYEVIQCTLSLSSGEVVISSIPQRSVFCHREGEGEGKGERKMRPGGHAGQGGRGACERPRPNRKAAGGGSPPRGACGSRGEGRGVSD